jgi:hypothetical protein
LFRIVFVALEGDATLPVGLDRLELGFGLFSLVSFAQVMRGPYAADRDGSIGSEFADPMVADFGDVAFAGFVPTDADDDGTGGHDFK